MTYEVVWTDGFVDPGQLGICYPDRKQIIIKRGLNPRKTYFVFVHEVLHAINFEDEKMKLTEAQVEALENGLNRLSRLNGWTLFEQ